MLQVYEIKPFEYSINIVYFITTHWYMQKPNTAVLPCPGVNTANADFSHCDPTLIITINV